MLRASLPKKQNVNLQSSFVCAPHRERSTGTCGLCGGALRLASKVPVSGKLKQSQEANKHIGRKAGRGGHPPDGLGKGCFSAFSEGAVITGSPLPFIGAAKIRQRHGGSLGRHTGDSQETEMTSSCIAS